jgi:arylesterase / paraoxonase
MRKLILGLLLTLLVLGGFVFNIFISTGYFREVESHNSFGPVVQTIDLPGVEDLALARADSLLILSVDDRIARREGKIGLHGLYLIDLRTSPFEPILLTEALDFPFFPHGLSIYPIDSSRYSLMAINHVDGQHSVEQFLLSGKTLSHQRTIRDPNFISPNDLVMLAADQFYYSNDHGYSSEMGVAAENYLGLKVSNVGYYNGKSAEIKAKKIGYANGIQFDSSRRLLYVAAVRSFLVKVYQVENWNLTHVEDIKAGTGVDNIELDESGALWIGAHPNLLRFASYASGKTPDAPSEVIRINYKPSNSTITSLYTDSGSEISGSSVALPFGNYLFVGNVMDSKMLVLKKK